MPRNLRDVSKEQHFPVGNVDDRHINAGSLQRIADSLEKHLPLMVTRYEEVIHSRDYYERRFKDEQTRVYSRDRQIAALRGQITKLKKRLAERTQQ